MVREAETRTKLNNFAGAGVCCPLGARTTYLGTKPLSSVEKNFLPQFGKLFRRRVRAVHRSHARTPGDCPKWRW